MGRGVSRTSEHSSECSGSWTSLGLTVWKSNHKQSKFVDLPPVTYSGIVQGFSCWVPSSQIKMHCHGHSSLTPCFSVGWGLSIFYRGRNWGSGRSVRLAELIQERWRSKTSVCIPSLQMCSLQLLVKGSVVMPGCQDMWRWVKHFT